MRALRSFIRKEVWHILRDRRTLLILFGLPVAQLILFGYAIRSELDRVPIVVLDATGDPASVTLVQHLTASGYFTLAGMVRSEKEVWPLFEDATAKAVVSLPPTFWSDVGTGRPATAQVVSDASDPNTARTISSQLTQLLSTYRADGSRPSAPVSVEVRLLYNPEMKSVYMFVPGLMAFILLLVSALMTSIAVTREKELGTMEVLLISPLRPFEIIIGKVAAYVALACVNVVIISVLAVTVFQVPFRGSLALFALLSFLYIVTALALGIFISARVSTQQTAMITSLGGLLLPTILLSGFIFPVASMPVPLQWLSHIVPARWYLEAARGIMIKGAGWEVAAWPIGILAVMAVVFLVLAWRNLKDHLES